jgi:hypothetical protein
VLRTANEIDLIHFVGKPDHSAGCSARHESIGTKIAISGTVCLLHSNREHDIFLNSKNTSANPVSYRQ